MPLLHIAWFRFKDGVATDRIERHLAACRSPMRWLPTSRNCA